MILGMDRIPLAYTFGNHMHWVDMEWLWGYHVLPGSVRDMIHLCREAGVKGCVNFDGIGYEKLAVENPEAFQELREAIRSGLIEVVGASYGQPYGLFHGGESNIRQRVYGVRTCMRLFGVRPRTFWEEEFDFFPQLPQILAGCGFTGASLYFQWTWHTPEIPREQVPVILWEGLDGTRLPTATRNRLNLHQWPEDMDILLKELVEEIESAKRTAKALHRAEGEGMIDRDDVEDTAITIAEGPKPLILQWLELMPSPDWMCRSEVILPKLRELLDDPRFEIERLTLGEYLAKNAAGAPVRRYSMDEVWHGMTLGKNGERMRSKSRDLESQLVFLESQSATMSLFGRPYRQWDIYPTWEIEEAWRYLLMAQHHDNDECEGLCGRVGVTHYEAGGQIARQLQLRQQGHWSGEQHLKPVAWQSHLHGDGPFGWKPQVDENLRMPLVDAGKLSPRNDRSNELDCSIEFAQARIRALLPDGASELQLELLAWPEQGKVSVGTFSGVEGFDAECVHFLLPFDRPEPGLNNSVQLRMGLDRPFRIITDQAYSILEVHPSRTWPKKYPTGDWMTSSQWFESVERPFTSYSFVDLVDENGSGVLILHNVMQQWFRDDDGVRCIISAHDPWDEEYYVPGMSSIAFVPHGPITNADRWRVSNHCRLKLLPEANLPLPSFSPVKVTCPNVAATAFYREIEEFSGRGLESYAGRGMGYPFILRLVEFDGIAGKVEVTLPGPIAKAIKTNLMGEVPPPCGEEVRASTEREGVGGEGSVYGELKVKPGDPNALVATPEELAPFGIIPETIIVPMRPYEIATIYLDLVPGRKVARDLDAKREVWATVHRTQN